MRSWPSSPRAATLYEQAVIAATGFLSMLFFARHLPTLDWATFSFAAGLLLLAQGMQLSIVILPMISFSQGRAPSPQDQAHWTWMNRAVLLAMLGLSLLAGAAMRLGDVGWMGTSFLLAALLMPPAFGYEYLRRRLILAGQTGVLARAGTAYAAGVALAVGAQYTLATPAWLAALTYWPGIALALCAWLAPLRRFAPSAVGSSLAFAGYNLAVQALLGASTGAAAVASFNATRMLIQPVNTLIGAFNALDLPRAAQAHAHGGRALVRFQTRAVLRLAAVGGLYLGVLLVFAGPVLDLLFAGRYSDEAMLWSWVIVGFLMLVATPTENVFYVTRQPQLLLLSRVGASIVGCGMAYVAIPPFGAVGAVLSIAAGWSIALLGGLAVLWRVRETRVVSTS
jgi:O-antigen/teichoic acid export membrane protein